MDLKFGGFLKKVVLAKTKKEEINKLTSLVKTVWDYYSTEFTKFMNLFSKTIFYLKCGCDQAFFKYLK